MACEWNQYIHIVGFGLVIEQGILILKKNNRHIFVIKCMNKLYDHVAKMLGIILI